ncbi:HNH endonuclease signature motif containing protein [Marisediminicola antarctica]|uniref:HNH nuclease domain-containing protein n=1 Tax=Marisediminicola antarctica TaxID=674079 RepID=A0A7L5ADR5_9MICO|nr:HNH endonuclease signature motif containing protein [Marisediminicola antarctica]QHO68353.1 hypothetical protein BHD05_00550 [Marisediminicola antarctica]
MSKATDPLIDSAIAFASVWAGALTGFGARVGEHPDARPPDARGAGSGAAAAAVSVGATAGASFGAISVAPSQLDVETMSDAGLVRAIQSGYDLKRHVDALLVRAAGELSVRSRPSLGQGGLAKSSGHTSPASLITELGRVTLAEAGRTVRLGEATTAPVSLLGERLPAPFPLVADAVNSAVVQVDAAQSIITSLTQAAPRALPVHLVAAEEELVTFAASHPADTVRKLSISWRDALDTDGIAPREEALIAARSLRWSKQGNGLERCTIDLDPLGAGYVRTMIDAMVGDALRAVRFDTDPTGPAGTAGGHDHGHGMGDEGLDRDACGDHHVELPDPRTIPRIAADALIDVARHMMGCTTAPGPLPHTTLIIRMTLEQLQSGLGAAHLDGVEDPITAGAARRLAADAELIPAVLGGNSQILDLGTGRRLFTRAQRIAFAERDGGCAITGCGRPPSYTEAHHIHWWSHGGTTNLNNGILLCTGHHHIIHKGWTVQITDNTPWFTPPPHIDPTRTPKRGGKLPTPALQ